MAQGIREKNLSRRMGSNRVVFEDINLVVLRKTVEERIAINNRDYRDQKSNAQSFLHVPIIWLPRRSDTQFHGR